MRLLPERSPFPRVFVFPLLALGAAGAWLARTRPDGVRGGVHCPLRDATGIPCPTCGGTQAAVALAHGDLRTALAANPLVVAGGVAVAVWAAYAMAASLRPGWRRRWSLGPRESRCARWLVLMVASAAWLYQVARLGIR